MEPVRACAYALCGKLFHVNSAKHRCCCKEHSVAHWKLQNPEKVREQRRRRPREKTTDKVRARRRRWDLENPGKRTEAGQRYRLRHGDRLRAEESQKRKKLRAFIRASIKLGLLQLGELQ